MNPNDSFTSDFLYATISGWINRSELVTLLFNPWMARMFSPVFSTSANPAMLNSTGVVAMESGRFCGAPDFQLSDEGALSLAIFLPLMNAVKPSSYFRRNTTSSICDRSVTVNGTRMYTDSVLLRISETLSPMRLP